MMMWNVVRQPDRSRRRRRAVLAALAAFLCAAAAAASDAPPLNAALLTRDLGDPRRPGNVKLVLGLPRPLSAMTAGARPGDFRVYVHPAGLSRDEGLDERYRAGGVHLWRHRGRIFLDARTVPAQDEEGPASVRIVFAPEGKPLAEGVAEGQLRYTSELVDVVLAVDVSRSMLNNDPNKRRVAAARAFIDMARQGGGIGRVGLVTFNHRPSRSAPLMPLGEGEALIGALDGVGADGLTNLDGPIRTALEELRDSRRPVIILLTDGRNEGSRYRDAHLAAAERGARIFTVGLSEQADHELLRKMADDTDGIYFRAVKDSDLPEIYARLAAELGKRRLLRAEVLRSAGGEKAYPIDSAVERLVALADGGARVAAIGGGGMFSTGMAGVLMGRPEPGEWLFAWSGATPDVSTLALFGDTQFFLDAFPPQLLGDRLAVGATLAMGDRPLAGGSVWVEPLPGVLARRLELFDDGRHGDGGADDGVYAGSAVLRDAPERFDLTIRASGAAWDGGDFVRQTAGLAIKAPAPPPGAAVKLDGEVDFGVLFPGETGTADVGIELDAPSARDLRLALSWEGAGEDWPEFASALSVSPGRRAFRLEISIPASAEPGSYAGAFRAGDGDEIDEEMRARVTVGTVGFTAPGAVDLGVVPPGTFVSRMIDIPYRADKAAGVAVGVDGADDIAASSPVPALAAGEGILPVEIVVSAPMDRADGGYEATVRATAGPGSVEIPVVWQVRRYAASAPAIEPMTGLPSAPELPSGTAPLEKASGPSGELWRTGPVAEAAGPADSPWEKTERMLRRGDGASGGRGASGEPGAFAIPEVTPPAEEDDSFWSAWWLYILAALLLLLLLLLLIAYILYRLGKSALARFLLASALANIILMVLFILLLSTGASAPAVRAAPISVNLVENDRPAGGSLTQAEESLLGGSLAASGDGSAGGGEAMAGGAELSAESMAGPSGGQLAGEKEARLPENDAPETEIADALRPSAMPLEQNESRPLRRAERPVERDGRTDSMPSPELVEMAEPPAPAERASRAGRSPADAEPAEERLEIEAAAASDRPVWSTGEKPVENPENAEGSLLAGAAGMETVSRDRTAGRIGPRGRRRSSEASPAEYPEPRVEIDDPVRDAADASAAGADEPEGEPGSPELRVAVRAAADYSGEKPGAVLPTDAPRLFDNELAAVESGASRRARRPELSRPMGGSRSVRGGAAATESDAEPGVAPSAPGSSASSGSGGTAAPGTAGGSNSAGGAVGERRFDDEPPGGAAGGAGIPDGSGGARTPAAAAGGGGSGASPSPSPLASGGGGSGSEAFVPAEGGGGGLRGGQQRTGGAGRAGRENANGSPRGGDEVPGSGGTSPAARGGLGGGGSAGRGKSSGPGEGRFDDMGTGGGGAGEPGRRGGSTSGGGSADLAGAGGGPGVVPLSGEGSEWKRIDRRPRPRSMAVAASAVDAESLLIVVGDFARLPDSAAENLFSRFASRLGHGMEVEERRLSPGDDNLHDTLLALATPEQVGEWSDAETAKVAEYLGRGGHIWLDGGDRDRARAAMERLAGAAGGEFGGLPESHQLAGDGGAGALTVGGELAAIATYRGWRDGWRHNADGDEGTMRHFIRTVNYFLSGDADAGVVLAPGDPVGETLVQPYREIIPDTLAGAPGGDGVFVWDDFGPETAAAWRMPAWSDPGSLSAISDGQGGRALKLDLGAAAKGRAAAYRTLQPAQDFSAASAVTLDAYYDGGGEASLSMVFTVNEDGTWRDYETPRVRLAAGWNALRFDMDAADFRPLTPGGAEDGRLPASRARTGRAGFFLYRDGGSAAMALLRGVELVRR